MRIRCPFCGERDASEFTYAGAANGWRPDPVRVATPDQVFEAVYLRDNPAGPHEELWYHVFGCRSWLQVTRDTRTHEMTSVRLVKDAAS
jgi:heterotetrameric sarcosine oxidase delta subunit